MDRIPSMTRAPWQVVLPAAIAASFLALPLLSLSIRTPWRALPRLLSDRQVLTALRLSAITATTSMLSCVLIGVPLAWVLARTRSRWITGLRTLVLVPLVLPPVVGGVALLLAFGRNGILGRLLDAWFGVTLPFTTAGVVLAQTFVALPFLVITVEGALRSSDTTFEEAASTLGASTWTTFRRVTLPLIAPALAAGAALSWARALGEFGATITFAGNFAGRTQTLPLSVYLVLETDPQAALALSLVLLLASLAIIVLLRRRWVPTIRVP